MPRKPTAKPAAGKLIALDGARSADLLRAGKRLLRELSEPKRRGGVSQWDASGLFFQIGRGGGDLLDYPSPKTLVILYAADLAFRLRWEIEPLRAEGKDVVAAPYVETGVGFGLAAGLDREWLTGLFSFAPQADATYRLPKASVLGKGAKPSGFVDHCLRTLAARPDPWKRTGVTRQLAEHLNQWGTAPHTAGAARRAR